MISISIFLPNLRAGGAERLAVNLANDWIKRGFNVEFVLMNIEGELLALINPRINLVSLNVNRIRKVIVPLRKYIRNKKPDIIWANMWPLTSVAVIAWLLAFRQGKIFLTDHNHLSLSCVRELGVSRRWLGNSIRRTYIFATGVTSVSNGVASDLSQLSGFQVKQIKVIYNPAAIGVSSERLPKGQSELLWGKDFDYHILAVGSLKAQKNHTMLLRAFAKLTLSINAKLTILGEGQLRLELENIIKELKLQDRVSLPGFYNDPYPFFRSADLFILSSDWEGFGNVIVEALECGVPVVSTDCLSGPAEILENGRYGRLVPVGDFESLSVAMQLSLTETHNHDALIRRAKDFSIEIISEEYLGFFGVPCYV